MARRDLLDLKVMGFNMIRFIWGGAERYQLDLCDEIGLMVYEESFASWGMQDSPKLAERWERSLSELIRRDRNHPSVVIWGLLNEVRDTPHFRLAAASLPLVRKLDETRMVFLNSGRWDLAGVNDEVFSKLDIWHSPAGREPWATLNPSAQPVETPFSFTWPPRQVALHPGPQGEYSVVRWTAPAADRYRIAATFTGLFKATTDVHLFHNGRPLFAAQLNIGGKPEHGHAHERIGAGEGRHAGFRGRLGKRQLRQRQHGADGDDQIRHGPRIRPGRGFSPPEQSRRAVVVRLARAGRQTRPGHVRPLHGVAIQSATASRQPGQSRLGRMGGRRGRPAQLPARAADGGHDPELAEPDRRKPAAVPVRIRHRQRGGPVAHDPPLRAARQDGGRGRAVLSRQARPLPRRLETVEARRVVCAAGGFLRREPAQDGGPAHARAECDSRQPEHRRLQPDRHERPRQLRRRADDDVPRTEARHGGRDVRGLRAVAAVPVRRAGERLSRHARPLRGGVGQRRRAGRPANIRCGCWWSARRTSASSRRP